MSKMKVRSKGRRRWRITLVSSSGVMSLFLPSLTMPNQQLNRVTRI